ncbi:MAG TPA: helix-turn-helix domain-containing protein, partial [Ktedonobacterales bacterium]|nr:helix-turn-helix domain-containing protein [Ktedonobacterales bacterium]
RDELKPRVVSLLLRHLRLAVRERKLHTADTQSSGLPTWGDSIPAISGAAQGEQEAPTSGQAIQSEREALADALESLVEQHWRVAFLLDDFETALETIEPGDEAFLRMLTRQASFVVTLSYVAEDVVNSQIPSPFLDVLVKYNLRLLREDTAARLITEPLRASKRNITQSDVDTLIWLGGRQPYLLTAVCAEYVKFCEEYGTVDSETTTGLLATDAKRAIFIARLLHEPQVTSILRLLWKDILASAPSERSVLYAVARGDRLQMIDPQVMKALRDLSSKGFVVTQEGRSTIFSEVFRLHVLAEYTKLLERRQPSLAQMREKVASDLGPTDQKVFTILSDQPNTLCRYEDLRREVWGKPDAPQRALNASVNRIRRKLEELDPRQWEYIVNIRNEGYTFKPRPSADAR